jgi:hypothetical protein
MHLDVSTLQGPICYTWTYLHHKGLSCTWAFLENRSLSCSWKSLRYTTASLAAPGLIYTTMASIAPGRVYTTGGVLLHLEVSTPQGPDLHLCMSGQQVPLLLLYVFTLHRRELHLDLAWTCLDNTGACAAPGYVWTRGCSMQDVCTQPGTKLARPGRVW